MSDHIITKDTVLVLATHNSGKLTEFRQLMAPFGVTIKSAGELNLPEPEETGTTFEENAKIKALAATKATGLPALSDDSGLCVDALNGDPGVYTADWAQQSDGSRDFFKAMKKVEELLMQKGATQQAERQASFWATLCLVWPDETVEFFQGQAQGNLIWPPRGTQGFGYDPVFIPQGHSRTFGEMEANEKHGWTPDCGHDGLSHRARAFAAFAKAKLTALL